MVNYEPQFTFAVGEDCRTQARIAVETRTTAAHIRSGEYTEDQFSVYLTVRRYGSMNVGDAIVDALGELSEIAREMIETHVAPNILKPLARTIALK
ncbi:MAG: hypothetical protein QM811_10030 [Pirellulales bacterium]